MRSENRSETNEALARQYPVHVGVDTGKSFHQLVARGPDGRRLKAVRVDTTRASFDAADGYLTRMFPGVPRERMLVGIEFAGHHGFTFAHDLARRGYRIVTVLPSVTKRLKEIEDNSPRKDDAKDAAQICKLLASGLFVGFPMLAETETRLRVLATERRRLAVEGTRLKNRLHAVLDLAWPEFVGQFCTIEKRTPMALLRRWPTAADFAAASPRAIYALVSQVSRNHFTRAQIDAWRAAARTSIALPVGLDARRAEIQRLLARWDLVVAHATEIEAALANVVAQCPAAAALTTVPAVSVVCAATLVAELGTPASFESPRQVLKLAGMNLARRTSGTSVRGATRQTKRGRPALRRQLYLLAVRSCMKRGLYRPYYDAMLERNGRKKTMAFCAVARKMVPMLLHIMQTTEPFDAARWARAHQWHATV